MGNVGQLAADLVISTLQMKKVGHITDDSITPVVGNDPYAGCFSSRVGTLQLKPENVCGTVLFNCKLPKCSNRAFTKSEINKKDKTLRTRCVGEMSIQ